MGEGTNVAAESPYAGPVGIWGEKSNARGAPFLELMNDGKLAGSDGCNRMLGTWKDLPTGPEINLTASTMMACDGVDTWLRGARKARVHETTLVVMDADGEEIGRLTRTR